jgi:uncharacterized protein YjbI with pentapeptide repeats
MTFWKFAAILAILPLQASPVSALQKTPRPSRFTPPAGSCLEAAGSLGSNAIQSVKTIDGKTLKDVSDIRSLRAKARDNLAIVINGGDFSGKKFGNDNFSNICFLGTNLANTRWSKSRADGAGFIGANLSGAVFDRVSMEHVLFRNTNLTRTDASGAKLSYGQLDGGWDTSMAGLRLENAQMIGFRFQCGTSASDGCSFDRKQINLRGANLTDASLASFTVWDANLVDVILNNTEISLDQIPQYADANITGPMIVRATNKRVTVSPDAFRLAMTALSGGNAPDTECSNPDKPLLKIFCQTGQSELRAYRDDVDRLYASTSVTTRSDGTIITVIAPGKEQEKYLNALRKCALKEEDAATLCITDKMTKRRAVLVAALTAKSPLEADARALFVNVQTPLVQAVARDARLASLTPLLVDAAPAFLLAYRDDDNALNARGTSQALGGAACTYSFAPVAAKTSRKAKSTGPTFAAWSSGAEFAVQPYQKVKRKKVKKTRKNKKGKRITTTSTVLQAIDLPSGPGCAATMRSGPLVRLPILDDDFDRLWAAQNAAV